MPNVASDTRGTPQPPSKRRFAIVLAADATRVLEVFEAPGWEPAVMMYVRKMQEGKFAERVTLREARGGEGEG